MSGIFGIFGRNGQPVEQRDLLAMRDAMAHWGPDGGGVWLEGCCGLGQLVLRNTPEACYERLPCWLPEQGMALTAEARIDNRDELCDLFGITAAERRTMPDSELIQRAWLVWGEDCTDRLLGDWSFAVWEPRERRLFLARDHHGNTALYVHVDRDWVHFASDKQALLALGRVPRRINELKLAQILVSWPGDGIQTIYEGIQRLPPAHVLTVTPDRQHQRRYWRLEDTPEVRFARDEDYVEGLREVFTEAVRCRLRSHRPVAATLSGGLDSGSVCAVAASLLGDQGRRLPTFSHVPAHDVSNTVGRLRFGDETPYIRATAEQAGNIDVNLLRSEAVSPLAAIRRSLAVHDTPMHAAGNHYWIQDILQTAQARGAGTLLTGQGGNATISWIGKPWLAPGTAPESLNNIRLRLKHDLLLPLLPVPILRMLLRLRGSGPRTDWSGTAIHPDFARRLDLGGLLAASDNGPLASLLRRREPKRMRWAIIGPGQSEGGAIWAESGAAHALEVRDPTTDKRVMAYTLGVPNRLYTGPAGMDRYLLRQAMHGLLPPLVVDTPRRGRQSADLVARLLTEQPEVERMLDQMRTSLPANTYLNVPRMAEVWRNCLESPQDPRQTHHAVTILTRGAMAGLFLDQQVI